MGYLVEIWEWMGLLRPGTGALRGGLAIALVMGTLGAFGQGAVTFNFGDFTSRPSLVRSLSLYPTAVSATNGAGQLVTVDRYATNTGMAGGVVISNVLGGGYRSELSGPGYQTTTNYFNFPSTNAGAVLNAKDWLTVSTNQVPAGSAVAYSQTQSDGRFVHLAGDTMSGALTNNVGFYGNGAGLTNIPGGVTNNQALPGNPTYGNLSGATITNSGVVQAGTIVGLGSIFGQLIGNVSGNVTGSAGSVAAANVSGGGSNRWVGTFVGDGSSLSNTPGSFGATNTSGFLTLTNGLQLSGSAPGTILLTNPAAANTGTLLTSSNIFGNGAGVTNVLSVTAISPTLGAVLTTTGSRLEPRLATNVIWYSNSAVSVTVGGPCYTNVIGARTNYLFVDQVYTGGPVITTNGIDTLSGMGNIQFVAQASTFTQLIGFDQCWLDRSSVPDNGLQVVATAAVSVGSQSQLGLSQWGTQGTKLTIPASPGSGILYGLTVEDAQQNGLFGFGSEVANNPPNTNAFFGMLGYCPVGGSNFQTMRINGYIGNMTSLGSVSSESRAQIWKGFAKWPDRKGGAGIQLITAASTNSVGGNGTWNWPFYASYEGELYLGNLSPGVDVPATMNMPGYKPIGWVHARGANTAEPALFVEGLAQFGNYATPGATPPALAAITNGTFFGNGAGLTNLALGAMPVGVITNGQTGVFTNQATLVMTNSQKIILGTGSATNVTVDGATGRIALTNGPANLAINAGAGQDPTNMSLTLQSGSIRLYGMGGIYNTNTGGAGGAATYPVLYTGSGSSGFALMAGFAGKNFSVVRPDNAALLQMDSTVAGFSESIVTSGMVTATNGFASGSGTPQAPWVSNIASGLTVSWFFTNTLGTNIGWRIVGGQVLNVTNNTVQISTGVTNTGMSAPWDLCPGDWISIKTNGVAGTAPVVLFKPQ